MQALNKQGIAAPSGGRFTFGATHRLLKRLEQLRIGPGPRSVSSAASARAYVDRSVAAAERRAEMACLVKKRLETLAAEESTQER